jgi:hypothetical protein
LIAKELFSIPVAAHCLQVEFLKDKQQMPNRKYALKAKSACGWEKVIILLIK